MRVTNLCVNARPGHPSCAILSLHFPFTTPWVQSSSEPHGCSCFMKHSTHGQWCDLGQILRLRPKLPPQLPMVTLQSKMPFTFFPNVSKDQNSWNFPVQISCPILEVERDIESAGIKPEVIPNFCIAIHRHRNHGYANLPTCNCWLAISSFLLIFVHERPVIIVSISLHLLLWATEDEGRRGHETIFTRELCLLLKWIHLQPFWERAE